MARYQYPLEVHGLQTILDDGVQARDIDVKYLLVEVLMELRKMNFHLQSITDEEIEEVTK